MTTEPPDGLTDAVLPATLADASLLPGPAVIGPYQLLRLIGEGGMGQVWLAEQQQPVHRREKGIERKTSDRRRLHQ